MEVVRNHRVVNVLTYFILRQVQRLLQRLFAECVYALDVFLKNEDVIRKTAVNKTKSFHTDVEYNAAGINTCVFHIIT